MTFTFSPKVNPCPLIETDVPGPPDEGESVMLGGVLILPIDWWRLLVNHKAPSGPAEIPFGS